jgi:hypothetical protein
MLTIPHMAAARAGILRAPRPTPNSAKTAVSSTGTVPTTATVKHISPDEDGTTFIGLMTRLSLR